MTPKEKAEELISKFYSLILNEDVAKQCALIVEDEIKKVFRELSPKSLMNPYESEMYYWQSVKEEIDKINEPT